ncbi:MAG: hypothetical protein LBR23_00315 [Spirochaetaceae bacterium]|nr:hypothetical protein [Spirochaetaceae bacterium]
MFFFFFYKNTYLPREALKSVREEVNALLAEIQRETDLSATIIEGRTAALKELIERADERILLAQKTETVRRKEGEVIEALAAQRPAQASAPAPASGVLPQAGAPAPASGVPPQAGAPVPASGVPRVTLAAEQITPKRDVRVQVIQLAGEGFPPEFIAEKLKISVSEVNLITDVYA